jgi:UPF0716 family protein affecting phage T7 exclusion
MWSRIKSSFRELVHSRPGERFKKVNKHLRSEVNQSSKKRSIYTAVGILLVVAGLLLSIPPGVPGFLVTGLGLGLIAARFSFLAKFFDKSEMKLRTFFGMKKR